jgi:hypothetical protein
MQLRLVWFQLVDVKGEPLTRPASLDLPPTHVNDQFLRALKELFADTYLRGVAHSDLQVYKNRVAFDDETDGPLEQDDGITSLGNTKSEALIVVVPNLSELKTPLFFGAPKAKP